MSSVSKAIGYFFILFILQTLLYFAIIAGVPFIQTSTDIRSTKNLDAPSSVSTSGFFHTAQFVIKFAFVEFYGLPLGFALIVFCIKAGLIIAIVLALAGAG